MSSVPLRYIKVGDTDYVIFYAYYYAERNVTTDSTGDIYPYYESDGVQISFSPNTVFCTAAMASGYLAVPWVNNDDEWVIRVLDINTNAPVTNTKISRIYATFVDYQEHTI